jgi:hypothetical protein
MFTRIIASFRSSFDPCSRSATAAAATAPAASGIVCINTDSGEEEKYKLKQFSNSINSHLIA